MSDRIIWMLCRRAIAAGDSIAQVILGGIEAVLEGSQAILVRNILAILRKIERWFLMRVTPLKDTKGVVISHADISGRVRMAQTLEKHVLLLGEKQEELESLTGKLLEAQEEERKRIARELHDDFNQRLAALSLELEIMERAPVDPFLNRWLDNSLRSAFRSGSSPTTCTIWRTGCTRPCSITLAWRPPCETTSPSSRSGPGCP